MLSGDNSILKKAGEAREETRGSSLQEEINIWKTNKTSDIYSGTTSVESKDVFLDRMESEKLITSIEKNKLATGETIVIGSRQISLGLSEEDLISDNIFVALYNDGTLVFSNNNAMIDSTKVSEDYGNIKNEHFVYDGYSTPTPWGWNDNITKVSILNKIYPRYVSYWFSGLTQLRNIENIENIDTKLVTDMSYMFNNCCNLHSLDLSSFDTRNVTTMESMFNTCTGLVTLNLSSFDTRKVTNMRYMFYMDAEFGHRW